MSTITTKDGTTIYDKDFTQEYLLARAILDHVEPYQPIRDLGARYVGSTGYLDKQRGRKFAVQR